jgi:hypothetical protein
MLAGNHRQVVDDVGRPADGGCVKVDHDLVLARRKAAQARSSASVAPKNGGGSTFEHS